MKTVLTVQPAGTDIIHFPGMDDFEISMQECLCDGEDYEEEQ